MYVKLSVASSPRVNVFNSKPIAIGDEDSRYGADEGDETADMQKVEDLDGVDDALDVEIVIVLDSKRNAVHDADQGYRADYIPKVER